MIANFIKKKSATNEIKIMWEMVERYGAFTNKVLSILTQYFIMASNDRLKKKKLCFYLLNLLIANFTWKTKNTY